MEFQVRVHYFLQFTGSSNIPKSFRRGPVQSLKKVLKRVAANFQRFQIGLCSLKSFPGQLEFTNLQIACRNSQKYKRVPRSYRELPRVSKSSSGLPRIFRKFQKHPGAMLSRKSISFQNFRQLPRVSDSFQLFKIAQVFRQFPAVSDSSQVFRQFQSVSEQIRVSEVPRSLR